MDSEKIELRKLLFKHSSEASSPSRRFSSHYGTPSRASTRGNVCEDCRRIRRAYRTSPSLNYRLTEKTLPLALLVSLVRLMVPHRRRLEMRRYAHIIEESC